MEIRKNTDTRIMAGELWKKFLLSAVAEDMLMGEVADHLYLSDMDFKSLSQKGEDYLISSVTETAFGDLVDEAAYNLSERAGDYRPWSDLSRYMGEEEIGDALFDRISSRLTRHSPEESMDNPYFRHVRVEGKTMAHHLALTVNDYLPGEFVQTYHEGFSEEDPFRAQTAGFFDGKVTFPVLLENGEVWMSLVLSEIESMREPIRRARGRVITYGLGLGYYAFMASEKNGVESVTVVELNPHVIALFKEKSCPGSPMAIKFILSPAMRSAMWMPRRMEPLIMDSVISGPESMMAFCCTWISCPAPPGSGRPCMITGLKIMWPNIISARPLWK